MLLKFMILVARTPMPWHYVLTLRRFPRFFRKSIFIDIEFPLHHIIMRGGDKMEYNFSDINTLINSFLTIVSIVLTLAYLKNNKK